MMSLRILLSSVVFSYALASQTKQQQIQYFTLQFWIYALLSLGISCFAGLCSGLTVGYMAISKQQMQIKLSSQSQHERKVAEKILSVLENHHLLLSTLLLANALSLETLPIFLDKIVPVQLAIIISTVAVVVFGEVIPQAYCTGPGKISIGYFFASFIFFLEYILYPFVKPVVYILDNWVGHHEGKIVLTKDNLKTVLYLHNSKQYGYMKEEIEILQNTLDLRNIDAEHCMIPLHKVFSMSEDQLMNLDNITKIEKVNISKILIYSKEIDNLIGFIKTKNLLTFSINEPKPIKNGIIEKLEKVNAKDNLLSVITLLEEKKINLAVVIGEGNKCKGIITLKQIFEKLVLKQFNDDDVRVSPNWNSKENVHIVQAKEHD